MLLLAVREDRQRGGRSSYDGAQNYARSPRQAPSTGSHPSTPRTVVVKRVTPKHKAILLPVENGNHAIVYQEVSLDFRKLPMAIFGNVCMRAQIVYVHVLYIFFFLLRNSVVR